MNVEEFNNPYVPYSNNRYQVTQFGDILDTETQTKIALVEKDDGLYVNLDWVDGEQLYNAAIVVIVSFRPYMYLPPEHFKEIIPLYRNSNNKDSTPNNLTYKLPIEGIEIQHPNFKGFCYIPEYSSYGITRNGRLYDIRRNKIKSIKTEFKDKKKAADASLINDHHKKAKTHLIYRLVGATFIDHNEDYEKLQINHINGNRQDSNVENLEWVTNKQNTNHAFDTGLTSINAIVECKNYLTNEIKTYRSIKYACDGLDIDFMYAKKSLEVGFAKIKEYPKDWYYLKYKKESWKELSKDEIDNIPVKRDTIGTTIKAFNVFTNNIIIFSSIGNAAKGLNVDLAGIIYHMRRDSATPYRGHIFRYIYDMRPFPTFTEDQLYLIKSNIENKEYALVSRGYSVIDLHTDEKKVFAKTNYLVDFLKIKRDTVLRKFKNNVSTYIFNDRYKVSLVKPYGVIE